MPKKNVNDGAFVNDYKKHTNINLPESNIN